MSAHSNPPTSFSFTSPTARPVSSTPKRGPIRSNKTKGELAVQGTSDDAATSKLSASELGYFEDPFLPFFVVQPSRRPPLINRGYYTRVAAIRMMIDEFLATDAHIPHQIVSLGAGADTTFFRLKHQGKAPANYFEVDFAELLLNKLHIIHRNKPLQQLITSEAKQSTHLNNHTKQSHAPTPTPTQTSTHTQTSTSTPSSSSSFITETSTATEPSTSDSSPPTSSSLPVPTVNTSTSPSNAASSSPCNPSTFMPSPNSSSTSASYGVLATFPGYHLITADLRHVEQLEAGLVAAGIDFTLPTLFLAECVLIYMHAQESAPVIKFCAERFTGGSLFVNYEQILPDDAFGKTMIENLNHRGCSLLGYPAYPTIPAHHERYLRLGWQSHVGWDMNDIYRFFLPREDTKRIETLELFDEYEEWHMIHAHYHISVAANEPASTSTSTSTSESSSASTSASASASAPDDSRPAVYSKLGLAGKSKDVVPSPTHHASTPHKEAQLKAILDKRAANQAVKAVQASPTQRPTPSPSHRPAKSPSAAPAQAPAQAQAQAPRSSP